jgi:hypothetical protein
MGDDWNPDIEKRAQCGLSEQRKVALVIRMRDERHARGKRFRTRRDNGYLLAVSAVKRNVVVSGGAVAVFEAPLERRRSGR